MVGDEAGRANGGQWDSTRAVEALRHSEQRYRALVEASPSAIMAIRDGRFLFTNPAGARLLGLSDPEEAVGLDAMDVVAPDSREHLAERIRRLEAGQSNPQTEIEILRPDGSTVVAESTSIAIHLDDGPAALIIAQDITDRMRAEQALEERLRFGQLVTRISTSFVGLSGSEFEQAIHDALAQIGRYFEVDAVRLYRLSLQGDVLQIRNMWRSERHAPQREMPEIHRRKFPGLAAHYARGESVVFGSIDECPQLPDLRSILKFFGAKAGVGVPLECDGSGVDVFAMDKVLSEHVWPEDIVEHSKAIGQVILSAMRRREAEVEVQDRYEEIRALKDRLEAENVYLREEVQAQREHRGIVGESAALQAVLAEAEQVAPTSSTVLILGETGTGKELLARAIHDLSPRCERPMVIVNCAAVPSTLMEPELFGREKGAYTGALTSQKGRFEMADGSTLFLDEITELSVELQAKLLRVLQEGEFERVGSPHTVKVDVRIIAATNRDPMEAVRAGRLRPDLYYRLNVVPITIPPLRDRREDIPLLVWAFIREFGERMARRIDSVPQETMEALQRCAWPGNVRELRNVIERGMIMSQGPVLAVHLPSPSTALPGASASLDEAQRQHILDVLEQARWRINGPGAAADILEVKPSTLRSKMKRLGIERPEADDEI